MPPDNLGAVKLEEGISPVLGGTNTEYSISRITRTSTGGADRREDYMARYTE